ncbi:MAG: DNA ligase [Nocardioides sp.]|uniref:ATP-dependent DNA ligase n=1 Tax=Nocardioides sp. TaxID=35761 RepID=UPI0039E71B0E
MAGDPGPYLPMLATTGEHIPSGPEWVHEVKWDGIRILTRTADTGAGIVARTRTGNDVTPAWPELRPGPARPMVVDGEVIALNDDGLPDFRALADRMHLRGAGSVRRAARARPATYVVFDLLSLDGRDLRPLPWTERRRLLAGLDLGGWQVVPTYDDGAMLHHATWEQGLEGTVAKRRTSAYRSGERSRDWLKFAHRVRGSYVVGGWRPQVGTRDRLAAVLVGEPTPAGLIYRGRVGSGIGMRMSGRLRGLLTPATASPFAGAEVDPGGGVPEIDARGTTWTEPTVVVEVEVHGRHVYDRLRQPALVGIRADLAPDDLRGGAR